MKYPFTGLRLLQPGVERHVGSILVVNEIGQADAYMLSHADKGSNMPTRSGYSFGGNQMDLAGNAQARALLQDILEHMGNSGRMLYQSIASKLLEKGNPLALSISEQQQINQALKTPYGREKIDEVFAQSVQKLIREVYVIIRSLPISRIQDSLQQSITLLLYLADYHNQFHIDAVVLGNKSNGKMYRFLSGEAVQMVGMILQLKNNITIEDLIRFELHTEYHLKRPYDLPRRHKNIAEYVVKML